MTHQIWLMRKISDRKSLIFSVAVCVESEDDLYAATVLNMQDQMAATGRTPEEARDNARLLFMTTVDDALARGLSIQFATGQQALEVDVPLWQAPKFFAYLEERPLNAQNEEPDWLSIPPTTDGAAAATFFTQGEREHFLKTYEPPPNTWVWLAGVESRYLAGLVQHIFRKAPPGDPNDRICCVTGVVGGLAFQLLVRRSMEADVTAWFQPRLAAWRRYTLLIYPQIFDVAFPPPEILANESLDPFAGRFGAPAKRDRHRNSCRMSRVYRPVRSHQL